MGEARSKPRSKWPRAWMVAPCEKCGAKVGAPCLNDAWDERQTPHKGRPVESAS